MDWVQFLIFIIVFVGLFTWNRTESRADYRHMEAYVKVTIDSIKEEIKDFHGRLCAIEERNKR